MKHRTPLNFLPTRDNLRILQAGTLIAVLLSVGMVSTLFSSSEQQTANLSDALSIPTASPTAAAAVVRPKAISENGVNSVAPSRESDTVRYYERETGKAFSVNLGTLKTDVLSPTRLQGFIRSYWLPYSDNVISAFQQPAGIAYRLFDYATKAATPLATDISALVASPDGRQIAYIKSDGDSLALIVSDVDGKNPRSVFTTRAQEIRLDWPSKETLSIASHRPDRTGGDLSLVGLTGELSVLMENRENLEFVWSLDGTRLLFSFFTPEQGISLWYRDTATGVEFPLGLPTSAQKCAWHGLTTVVTCGVPAKNSLGRDVPANESSTIDSLVTLDVATGESASLYTGSSATLVGVIDPLVSSSERYFVFTNLFDHRLYLFPL